jgi:hypothetical protein
VTDEHRDPDADGGRDPDAADDRDPSADGDPDSPIEALHAELAATAELPIERDASRWIGEAEAVAEDLVGAAASEAVVDRRVGHVRDLLAEVDDTGNEAADERVGEAERLTDRILDE